MKKPLIFALLALVIASFSCSIQNIEMKTIETQEKIILEPIPDNFNQTELVFEMTGGQFTIHPGAQDLVNGSITYNIEQWEPEITRSSNSLKITQVDPYRITGIPSGDVVNRWDLAISDALPLDLSIKGGASENEFNFSGLQLSNLSITEGASKTIVQFDIPNPIVMEQFNFTTGASSANIYGLANANFEAMTFSAGAGDYTLDFSGQLTQDAIVEVKAGVSNLTIIIPQGIKAVVNNNGTISNITTSGTWLVTDNTYTTLTEGLTLTINLNMAVGNVNLKQE